MLKNKTVRITKIKLNHRSYDTLQFKYSNFPSNYSTYMRSKQMHALSRPWLVAPVIACLPLLVTQMRHLCLTYVLHALQDPTLCALPREARPYKHSITQQMR